MGFDTFFSIKQIIKQMGFSLVLEQQLRLFVKTSWAKSHGPCLFFMAAAYSLTAVATERYWCCYAAVITIISTTFFSMPTEEEEEGREAEVT